MASGILSVFDDVAALMDDVAVAGKLATRKTAGIIGDDLAVNAEKATGFLAARELPVLWAITKGSFINKLIIVPVALLLSAFLPALIKITLVLGGFYLAYEGVEKVIEFLFHRKRTASEVVAEENNDSQAEKIKIKSAVTTDFILSIEIVIIALGAVIDSNLVTQIITVSLVSLLATVGVYGLVALIVRMDDIGFKLIKRSGGSGMKWKFGHLLIKALPVIIKILGFVGTIALLLVSGGIFLHNIKFLHHGFPQLPEIVNEFIAGVGGGLIVLGVIKGGKKLIGLR
jgi:uncharacterized protein